MNNFKPADNLRSRTFIGMLVAQFFAAFNDQAIHASAMFFAINTGTMSEARAISLMPILFYAPWAIFCTIAGYMADRYSKRFSLVLWKFIEVGITLLALFGFWYGMPEREPRQGAFIVLSTVFLMGMHSAFFVPAKYGAMPEILTPRMLSKGNGILESLSFLAVILGTVFGGVLSAVFRDTPYWIGAILTGLAIIGAIGSLFIEHIPAANPNRPFPPYIFKPLFENIRLLFRSRPLVFAVVGIAFFTFLVAYMRAVVYMHGQSQLPPWDETRTSLIVGMVALGIGIGSPLVGFLSGGKVEIGLVPIGAMGMILATTVAAFTLTDIPVLVTCIIFIGFFTGFYLVPLFSLLQHRAPKTSKGDAIATSNFINISGAIAASLVFAFIDWSAIRTGFASPLPEVAPPVSGFLFEDPEYREGHPHRITLVEGNQFVSNYQKGNYALLKIDQDLESGMEVMVRTYRERGVTYYRVQEAGKPADPIYNKQRLPALLFLTAGGMTLLTLLLLWYLLPDLLRRSLIWFRTRFRQTLELSGLLRLPGHGPVILATDSTWDGTEDCLTSGVDRTLFFLTHPGDRGADNQRLEKAKSCLHHGQVVALCLDGNASAELFDALKREAPAPILPVYYASRSVDGNQRGYLVAGNLLPAGTDLSRVQDELASIRERINEHYRTGKPLDSGSADH